MFARTTSRFGLPIAACLAASALVLTGCSSDEAAEPVVDVTETAPTEIVEEIVAADPPTAAETACASFFELDLLSSAYAGGLVASGDMTEARVKREYKRILDDMITQAELAVAEGEIEPKIVVNAKRMQKTMNGMKKRNTIGNQTKKQRDVMQKQMTRIERTCNRAGFPLPEENVIARADLAVS
jgi:PBP1b-binding outer membrane lipoprotein LpoB